MESNANIVTSISYFATTMPPPPPLVVPIDLTDIHSTPAASILDLEDLDSPAQKLSDDPIKSTSSMRFLPGPYSTTRERPKTAAEKGKRESPTPWASQSSTSQRRQAMAAKILWTPRPDNATKQNLEKLLKWNADEYKEFRAAITLGCRRLLDSSRSWQAQDTEKLAKLKAEILGNFLRLQQYQDAWPFEVAVQEALKSSATASKKKAT